MAGIDTDAHQRDLYESIQRGHAPSWTLYVQIMPFEEAKTYRSTPSTSRKSGHSDYPLHEVGRMVLNQNVTDYHSEIEQAAFEPNNLIPGTGLSPDKMLLARGLYSDAHRARLGVNYKQIPVNAPKVDVRSYSKDGVMRIRSDRSGLCAELDGWPADRARQVMRGSLDGRRRHGAQRLHPPNRRRRLGSARHPGARRSRRRRPKSSGGQCGRTRRERRPGTGAVPVFEYWRNIDADVGEEIENRLRAGRHNGN